MKNKIEKPWGYEEVIEINEFRNESKLLGVILPVNKGSQKGQIRKFHAK